MNSENKLLIQSSPLFFLLLFDFPRRWSLNHSRDRIGSPAHTQRIGRRRRLQSRRRTATHAQYQGNNVGSAYGMSINGHHLNGDTQSKRRVVITGMGVVSPFGTDIDDFYNVLLDGKSGVSHIENFDVTNFPTKIAAEVRDLDCDGYVSKKWVKRTDNYIKFGLVAGKKALEHSKLAEVMETLDKQRYLSFLFLKK